MVRHQITGKASKDHLLLLMLMAEVAHRCRGTNPNDHGKSGPRATAFALQPRQPTMPETKPMCSYIKLFVVKIDISLSMN
uniref:Putative secreted protein n=1 Tax=Ixodes ricinus TaxID=34613 RepID=A0A6B0TVJ3_IXORI